MGEITAMESTSVDRPVEEVLAVLRDIDGQAGWWPGQFLSEALETDEEGRVLRARIGNDLKVAKEEFEVVYTHDPGTTGYSWVLDGSTLAQKAQRGAWTLTPRGSGCEVGLEIAVVPLLPLPGFVLRKLVGDTVKDALKALKRHCEQR